MSSKLSFKGNVRGNTVDILIDSGADGNFINKRIVEDLKLPTTEIEKGFDIVLPNGQRYEVQQQVKALKYQIQEYEGTTDFHILQMDASLFRYSARRFRIRLCR